MTGTHGMPLSIHCTLSGAAEARLEYTQATQTKTNKQINKQLDVNWALWFMPVIPVFRLGKNEFKSSLG